MASSRKDHKGRVLKSGESQRKDEMYMYRYTDERGKRRVIYAMDLKSLREKESKLMEDLANGIDYDAGKVTVLELLQRYIKLRNGVKYNTKVGYQFVLNLVSNESFGKRHICDIKVYDAKRWFVKLQEDGRGYSTINSVRGVIKPAFQMAYNEDAIRRNPFDFPLAGVILNDTVSRKALSESEKHDWMEFIRTDKTYSKYYDEFVVLLGTGMRVSEFCGLTLNDIDLDNRRINVDHQLLRERGGKYFIQTTKTKGGCRLIPMTDEVFDSMRRLVQQRKKKKLRYEMIIDGYSNFLLLDKNNKPKVALHIENECRWALKKYDKLYPGNQLPHITPHVFRHTFCTDMANAGLDIKNLQYVMGHSDADVTLNVYTHASYDHAAQQMADIIRSKTRFSREDTEKKVIEK